MDTNPRQTEEQLNALTQRLIEDGMNDELPMFDEDPIESFVPPRFDDYMESDMDQPLTIEHDFLP